MVKLIRLYRRFFDTVPLNTRVKVTHGRFKGVSGVVKRHDKKGRYRVNLNSGRGSRSFPRAAFRLR